MKSVPAADTCWHEAGHAVVAVAQGLRIDEVGVVAADDYRGYCASPSVMMMFDNIDMRERQKLARCSIVASYAGLEAERLITPDAPDWHADGDRANALETSREYHIFPRGRSFVVGDATHLAFLNRFRKNAKAMVQIHRLRIKAVAEALSRTVRLTHNDVLDLCGL